jgi:hypothetical protein
MRTLAELLEATAEETPYGGRAVSLESLGWAWLALGQRRSRDRAEEGLARAVETVEAEVRADDRLTEGRVLRFGGGDWAIRRAEPDARRPGRMKLTLERDR